MPCSWWTSGPLLGLRHLAALYCFHPMAARPPMLRGPKPIRPMVHRNRMVPGASQGMLVADCTGKAVDAMLLVRGMARARVMSPGQDSHRPCLTAALRRCRVVQLRAGMGACMASPARQQHIAAMNAKRAEASPAHNCGTTLSPWMMTPSVVSLRLLGELGSGAACGTAEEAADIYDVWLYLPDM